MSAWIDIALEQLAQKQMPTKASLIAAGCQDPELEIFQDELHLQQAIVLHGWQLLAQEVRFATQHSGELRFKMMQLADRFRRFVHAQPQLYRLMNSQSLRPAEAAEFHSPVQDILNDMKSVLGPLGHSQEQVIHIFRVIRAAIHGFVELELNDQFALDVSVEDSYQWLLKGIFHWL